MLSSLSDNGSSPITPRRSMANMISTSTPASTEALPLQSWHSIPIPSPSDSEQTGEPFDRRDSTTPRTPNPSNLPMYRQPHHSAVSIHTTSPHLPVSLSGRGRTSKPGTGDSTKSKTSSVFGAFVRYPSSLGRSGRERFPSWSNDDPEPASTETSLTMPHSSAPASLLSLPVSSSSRGVHGDPRARSVVRRDAPPPYQPISDD